jgi:NifU-like protein involved in Fe-S cluster formation
MEWFDPEAADVGTGEVSSVAAGEMTRIQVRVNGASGRIEDAVCKVIGSGAATASAQLVVTRLKGASIADARDMSEMVIVGELQLPMEHAYAAKLAVEAAQRAIDDWERKQ